MENELLKLTLNLYSNPVIPRNVVQTVMDAIINFFNITYLNYVQQQIKLKSDRLDEETTKDILSIMQSTKTVFENFMTEHRRFSLYKQKGLMIDPISVPIGTKAMCPTEYKNEFSSEIKIDDTSKSTLQQNISH